MFQVFIIGYTLQFLLNNLLDFLLDAPVIRLHRFLHAVVAAYSGGYPFSISGDIRSVPS